MVDCSPYISHLLSLYMVGGLKPKDSLLYLEKCGKVLIAKQITYALDSSKPLNVRVMSMVEGVSLVFGGTK